jgi:DNA-binding NarL/FixJ family response regulator
VSALTDQAVHLGPRPARLLALFAEGKTHKEISAIVFLAMPTVRNMLVRTCEELGARSNRQAIVIAVAHGFLVPKESGEVEVDVARCEASLLATK